MLSINIKNPISNSILFTKNPQIQYEVTGVDINVKTFVFLVNNKKFTKTDYFGSLDADSFIIGKNKIIVYAINKKNKKILNTEKQINFEIREATILSKTEMSLFSKSIVPEFILTEYPQFVTFIQKYYEFLQTSNTPYLVPFKQSDFNDIDNTSDYFIPYFYSQFLPDFPKELGIDNKSGTSLNITTVIKNIKKFYESKGTLNSYKFLFRFLFDTEIDIEYPRDKILKASGGNWIERKSIKIFSFNDSLTTELNNRFVYQIDFLGNRIASARVQSIEVYRIDNYKIAELFIEDYVGNFDKNKKLLCDIVNEGAKETLEFYLSYCPIKININSSGFNYKINDRIYLKPKEFIFYDSVTLDGQTFSEITDFDYDIDTLDFTTPLPQNYFIFDGNSFIFSNFNFNISFFGKGYLGKVSKIGKKGEILEINGVNFGFNYPININDYYDIVIESERGTGFSGSTISGLLCEYEPFFSGNGGKLSSSRVLQDNDYYQSHSYQINTEVDISLYENNIKKLVHPTGYKLFGSNVINRKNASKKSSSYNIEELNG